MEQLNQQQPDNNLDKVEKPLSDIQIEVVENKVVATLQEKVSTEDTQQQVQQIQTINSEVVIKERKKTKIIIADKIAISGLFINIVLAVFTFLLFKEATSSTKIATDAVEEARRSNSISEKNYKLAKDAFEESKKSAAIANKTNETQINSIKENQKQFKVGNEPYLSIYSPKIEKFEIGQPILTRFEIENLGKYPCKITEAKVVTAIRISPPKFEDVFTNDPNYSDIINKYVVNGVKLSAPFGTTLGAKDNQIIGVKNGAYFIYLTGYIKYKNLISNKIKTYKFQLKMKDGYETENIINENFEN